MNPPESICSICGQPASEHHEFTTAPTPERPAGCKCNLKDWRQIDSQGRLFVIPLPCGAYIEDSMAHGQCVTCEHLEECHAGHNEPAPALAAAA